MALPSVAFQLGEVHPPLDVVALRPHDRGLAREFVRAFRLGLFHQLRNGAPGIARFGGIDAVEAKHHRRVEHVTVVVADLVGRAGPGREIAVAGAIDEDIGADRLPSRLGLDEQRVDARLVVHGDAGAERVKEDVDLVRGKEIVGGDLVGGGVIGLRKNLAEDQMRLVQPVEPIDPRQQVGSDALHHPMHLAMDVGMQPAEIGDAGGRPHAAEEAVAFDQQRAPPRARRRHCRRDPRRPAAEHGDFVFAVERDVARGFGDGFAGQTTCPNSRHASRQRTPAPRTPPSSAAAPRASSPAAHRRHQRHPCRRTRFPSRAPWFRPAPPGRWRAIARPPSRRPLSSSASGTTSCTRPMRRASSAPKRSPVSA